jgi:hypothetical protein
MAEAFKHPDNDGAERIARHTAQLIEAGYNGIGETGDFLLVQLGGGVGEMHSTGLPLAEASVKNSA